MLCPMKYDIWILAQNLPFETLSSSYGYANIYFDLEVRFDERLSRLWVLIMALSIIRIQSPRDSNWSPKAERNSCVYLIDSN